MEIFAVALAAVCHDVDHPGLTNAFLVAASDPISLRYNDKAVLESHHAATAFLTMRVTTLSFEALAIPEQLMENLHC